MTDNAMGRMLNQYFADNAAATEEPRAFPQPPGGRPSEGAESMAAYRPAVGTAQNAAKGSVSTAALVQSCNLRTDACLREWAA